MRLDVIPAIRDLGEWLESAEVATIALNGGWELTLRDRLLFLLQERYPPLVAVSEWPVDGARADLALLRDGQPQLLVELKHNYCGQLTEITGAALTVWDKKPSEDLLPSPRKQRSGLENDLAKWSARNTSCPIQFVHLVTQVEALDDVGTRTFKYSNIERPDRTVQNLERIATYFREIQVRVGNPPVLRQYPELTFRAETTEPYCATCRLNIFVVDKNGA